MKCVNISFHETNYKLDQLSMFTNKTLFHRNKITKERKKHRHFLCIKVHSLGTNLKVQLQQNKNIWRQIFYKNYENIGNFQNKIPENLEIIEKTVKRHISENLLNNSAFFSGL